MPRGFPPMRPRASFGRPGTFSEPTRPAGGQRYTPPEPPGTTYRDAPGFFDLQGDLAREWEQKTRDIPRSSPPPQEPFGPNTSSSPSATRQALNGFKKLARKLGLLGFLLDKLLDDIEFWLQHGGGWEPNCNYVSLSLDIIANPLLCNANAGLLPWADGLPGAPQEVPGQPGTWTYSAMDGRGVLTPGVLWTHQGITNWVKRGPPGEPVPELPTPVTPELPQVTRHHGEPEEERKKDRDDYFTDPDTNGMRDSHFGGSWAGFGTGPYVRRGYVPPMLDPYWPLPGDLTPHPPIPIPTPLVPHRIVDPFAPKRERPQWGYEYHNPHRVEIWTQPRVMRDIVAHSKLGLYRQKNSHKYARPGRRTREVKIATGSAVARVLRRAIGKITEIGDLVDALWDALPEAFRKKERAKRHGKAPKLLDKLQQIYDNLDKLDVSEAVKNIIKNEVQDRVIGKLAKGGQNLARQTGRPMGYSQTRIGSSQMQINISRGPMTGGFSL